jgi:hypothetical protein
MCPACLANATAVAGSVISTGGIAAIVFKRSFTRMVRRENHKQNNHSRNDMERRTQHGNDGCDRNNDQESTSSSVR